MLFEYWFMFPISIVIATIAMTFGIGGAVLFSPVFIILFPLVGVTPIDAANAFGAALLTEVVGFASGFFGYVRKGLIDFRTARYFLMFGVPLAVIGTFLKREVNSSVLTLLFSLGMLGLSLFVYVAGRNEVTQVESGSLRKLIDVDGVEYEYLVCNEMEGGVLAALGGFFTGLISVGIGETVVSTLRGRCNLPMGVAAGTSVFVVIVVVLSSAVVDIALVGLEAVPWTLVMFTMPGVLIGGQIGARISSRVSSETAERTLIVLFAVLAGVMLYISLLRFEVL